MAYWMDVVSREAECPDLAWIEAPLYSDFDADFTVVRGGGSDWREIALRWVPPDGDGSDRTRDRDDFATVSRVTASDELAGYRDEYLENLAAVRPASAARWLVTWLRDARSVYTFTTHHDRRDEAMAALRAVMWSIQRATGGVGRVDFEGWSNADGHQVTWEFVGDPTGPWWCAVLDEAGRWTPFRMELGGPAQREAFLQGRVPETCRR